MSSVIKPDNPFFNAMGKLGDLILLNMTFILFCVPIITIGGSICALHTAVGKLSRNRESHVLRDFFIAFKENFRNSTIIWLILAAAGIAIYFAAFFIYRSQIGVLYIPFIFILTIYVFILIYAFPLQAEFINTPLKILKNSLLTAVRHLPHTIWLILIISLPICITLMIPEIIYITLVYWVLIGFSLTSFISVFLYRSVFKLYK